MARPAPSSAPAPPARDAASGIEVATRTPARSAADSDVTGIAVHTASVLAEVGPTRSGSRTVKDLAAGSRFRFADRGTYTLKASPATGLFAGILTGMVGAITFHGR